jgi:hypothetical protein
MYRLRRIPPSPNLSHQGRGNNVSAAPIVLYGTSAGRAGSGRGVACLERESLPSIATRIWQ